jgi:hypothetical protein
LLDAFLLQDDEVPQRQCANASDSRCVYASVEVIICLGQYFDFEIDDAILELIMELVDGKQSNNGYDGDGMLVWYLQFAARLYYFISAALGIDPHCSGLRIATVGREIGFSQFVVASDEDNRE